MRRTIYLSLILCFISIIYSKKAIAQATTGDSSSQQSSFKNAVTLYHTSLGEQSPLYNGPEYYFYDPIYKGNAYFLDVNAFTKGSVFYYGVLYTDVPMIYDLYSDQLVVLLYNHFSKFSLIKERVGYFDFLDHHFVNINADSLSNNPGNLKSGFYDEIYKGKSAVLVKRSKSIQTNTGGTLGAESYFSPAKDFFLRKGNGYYSFGGQGSLLDILKDKKKEIEQFIKTNKIKYRRDPEDAMVKIVSYYDHLTN
jgi:hypothetical protein